MQRRRGANLTTRSVLLRLEAVGIRESGEQGGRTFLPICNFAIVPLKAKRKTIFQLAPVSAVHYKRLEAGLGA